MIGDALHNLRSALDILWHDIIRECGGTPSRYTRFPIRETADELEPAFKDMLKKKQIEIVVKNFLMSDIKPYKAGNYSLWALEDLNVRDKHQLLIPLLKSMYITGICLKDENANEWHIEGVLYGDRPWSHLLPQCAGRNLEVKNKGHATSTILFDMGFPFEGEPVLPALDRIAKEVSRTVKAFEALLFG